MEKTSTTITIEILQILKQNGVQINNIKKNLCDRKSTEKSSSFLKDIKQGEINIIDIIKRYNLNPYYKIVSKIDTLIDCYNGKIPGYTNFTEDERKMVDDLGLDTEKKDSIDYSLEILETLVENGVNLFQIITTLKGNNRVKNTLLKEIEQPGIDIEEIIGKNALNPNLSIGYIIARLNKYYNNPSKSKMSDEQIERFKKLGMIENTSAIDCDLSILRVLHENGVDLPNAQKNSKQIYENKRTLRLGDINQRGIDIEKIIKENNLEPDIRIGSIITYLVALYKEGEKSILNDEQKRCIEGLGILKTKKSMLTETLDILEVLKENGIDLEKINLHAGKGVIKDTLLKDIRQTGIDIMKIIRENNLDPNENMCYRISVLSGVYKGTVNRKITPEERKRAEELGFIRDILANKERQQQELQIKHTEAKRLRDMAQAMIEGSQEEK